MGDLVELIIRQFQLLEALDFRYGVPQGVIGAVGHPLRAVAVDIVFRLALLHEHQGAGNIKNAVDKESEKVDLDTMRLLEI